MDNEYEIVRISDERFPDFTKLARHVYGIDPTPAEMSARFHTEAWGITHLGYLAYHRKTGEVAAFYGVLPCFVEFKGKKYLACQGSSAMTHNEHRRRGLFFETAAKTYELATKEGIAFGFGFPNPDSYEGLLKLGWTHRENMNSYHIFIPTLPISFLTNRVKFLRRIHRLWIRLITSPWRVDDYAFPNSAADEGVATLVRDQQAVAPKLGSDDRFILRLRSGSSVWLNHHRGRIGIGDMDVKGSAREFRKILTFLKFVCFVSGTFHLQTHLSPGSRLDELFKMNGCRPRSKVPICDIDLNSTLPLEKARYVYADFDTF